MRGRRMLAAVLDGVALPGVVMEERSFKHHAPTGTDLARLREDMLSVSASFKKMMSQHGNRKAPISADAKDPASA